jgi:hypothetical protein
MGVQGNSLFEKKNENSAFAGFSDQRDLSAFRRVDQRRPAQGLCAANAYV